MKEQRKQIEEKKDELEEQKDELEKQCEEAKKSGDTELVEKLKEQIQEIETKRLEMKTEMKNIHGEIKEIIKNNYSYEELEELKELAEKIKEKYDDIKTVPIENIITDNKDMKFDTPPVIKEGRILIPVRAITRGMKADLKWEQEEKKVIINKDDIEIVLYIDKATALIDGEEIELDVPASLYNSSTYVPLRFIAENLGLKVDYDEDDDSIIIEDEEVEEDSNLED